MLISTAIEWILHIEAAIKTLQIVTDLYKIYIIICALRLEWNGFLGVF